MAGVDLVTVKDLLGHAGINMTVRYSHLVPEHKAQAVVKLDERYKAAGEEAQAQRAVVSPELKEAIGGFDSEVGTKPERFGQNVAGWNFNEIADNLGGGGSNRCIEVLQTSP